MKFKAQSTLLVALSERRNTRLGGIVRLHCRAKPEAPFDHANFAFHQVQRHVPAAMKAAVTRTSSGRLCYKRLTQQTQLNPVCARPDQPPLFAHWRVDRGPFSSAKDMAACSRPATDAARSRGPPLVQRKVENKGPNLDQVPGAERHACQRKGGSVPPQKATEVQSLLVTTFNPARGWIVAVIKARRAPPAVNCSVEIA